MTPFSRITLAVLVAAGAAASTAALAQPAGSQAPLTRAQVQADLVDWLQAGYDPFDWIHYPANAQRAGAIVAQRRAERAAGGQAQMQPQQ